jgi:lipoprotein-releasing system permease protein
MKLAFDIAFRFLTTSKGQSILIALGIAIGVSVQIFIGSLIQGLQIDLVDTTIGSRPHITIKSTSKEKLIPQYESLINVISSDYDVKHVLPTAEGPALITSNQDNYSILVRGLPFDKAEGIYKIKERLIEGDMPNKINEIVIGTNLKEEANIAVGDEIEVFTNLGESQSLTVTGIFDLQSASLNSTWVFSSLDTAQTLFSYDNQVTGIEMQVDDVFEADIIAANIQSNLQNELQVDNWKDQNASLLSGLNGQSVSSYMIQVFVMISVLLGIASILAITVVQKSKQIGILKAMGIQDKTASQIFVFQGLMLVVAGAILGVLLGLGLAFTFTKFALNPNGTPVVPLYISPWFILISSIIAILVSTLAALIPARKSSKLNPIEVIRNA